ncbi:L-seryl-tRNA(Sec) kinase [Methanofervidicoccus abyssi]|uniref:O-phosphoseryl-tRNA(Sec) kinase n=1 Tax=Methanofervidicoccus abyssi TaxID=2082189 RepID=A0A401HQK0_9EURY|nr:L-seryl-tRNA(Sec) kinase [Methanofervidicoccus abyssi]GBF36472.1 O-phosphoseryl-tRNA(Sec) kinase [Methanofervidicoccus abyssi]
MLIILVGLPSVGKSTFAKRLSKELYLRGVDNIVIGSDVIRECFPVWKREYEEYIKNTTYQFIDSALRKFYVIVDDTNYYNSKRRDLISIAKRRNKDYMIIYLRAPLDVILERNIKRGKKVPNELILEMYNKFDEPGMKYAWDRPDIVVDTHREINFDKIVNIILDKGVKKSKIEKNRKEDNSKKQIWDKVDKITRDVVGEYIKKDVVKGKDIRVILKLRKEFLKNLKSNILNDERCLENIRSDFKRFLNERLDNDK